ncbi:MAG: AAA family ATPase [Planctomycetaceae bacterium]
MLTQLSITGFRCFRQLDVELKPLTVLIGPNDTGKSAFLDAIEYLGPADPTKLGEFDRFRGASQDGPRIQGRLLDGGFCEMNVSATETPFGPGKFQPDWRIPDPIGLQG